MMKAKNLLTGMLAVLAVLLLTGCGEKDNPSRTSLDVDTSTLTLSVGETAVRMATSKAEDAAITYTSSNPAVATVDQFGKVTAMSEGTATITIDMAETKKSWYAAKTLTYSVVVKNVSAKALVNVDKATPLTLVAQADGKITVTFNNGITLTNDIKYTINNGAEQTIAKNTSGAYDIEVKKGDVVQLYSINTSLGGGAVAGARGTTRAVDSGAKYINIRPSMKTEIYGNVMSLLKGKDNLESATAIEAKNAFYGLFAGAEKLVNNAERLLVLPATTLTEGCYQDMFNGCKGIEKAPELPAPKLEKNCYQEMFYDCAKLNSVKCLATDIKAENSTKDWLGKAGTEASTKTLTTLVDMTPNSDDGVPTSWTAQKLILVTGIKLDKTELAMTIGGDDVTLVATVEPSDATDKTVTWTSNKPEVATVDQNGKVHAVGVGEATITANASEKTATCKVTVVLPVATVTTAPVATASVKPNSATALVTAGVADGGELMYAVTTTNTKPTSTEGFSAEVPTAATLAAGTYYVWYYAKADADHSDSDISAAAIEVTVSAVVDLSALTAAYEAKDGDILKGMLGGNYKISIAAGATVTLDGVTINGVDDANYTWAGINCEGNATIILKDGSTNTVKGFQEDYPGIHVKADYTLTIKGETAGTGSLTATGSTQGAGIGAGNWKACGNIVIAGGTINATAGGVSAGIGGGNNGTCGTISITGGNVTAVGVGGGAGIGGGNGGSCGNISITGGKVTATGGLFGAGIGAGSGYSTGTSSICGNINITGGDVTATGGGYSAGIGTGPSTPDGKVSQCGNITITSGVTKVMATKGASSPNSIGIGGNGTTGYNGICGTVTIGGTVGAITTTPYTYQP